MCNNCNQNNFVLPSPQQLGKGIRGLTKLVLGNNDATATVVKDRRDFCRECPEATKNGALVNTPSKGLTSYSQCKVCSCFIKAKTMLKDEQCPQGKW